MLKITNVRIDVKKVEKIICNDPVEGRMEIGGKYTIEILGFSNNHLSREEILKIFKIGQSNISIMEVL